MITAETKVYRLMEHDLRALLGLKRNEKIREATVTTREDAWKKTQFLRLDVVVDRPDKGFALKTVEWK